MRETSPSPIGVRGKVVDGRGGRWWARKTSPSLGGAHGKRVDGRG